MVTKRVSGLSVAVVLAALAGCALPGSGVQRPRGNLPIAPENTLQVDINAPAKTVQRAIVTRARARGTVAKLPDVRSVVLERALQDTPPALATICGPHQLGRIVRIIITTDEEAAGVTHVIERRFIVDPDGNRCAVVLSPGDRDEGNKSLQDLKNQVEGSASRR